MKGKITAVLFIVVFLLLVAVVWTFISSWSGGQEQPQVTTQPDSTAIIVEDPVPETSPAAPGTVNTPAPTAAVQTPAPTTAPAQTPTQAPVYVQGSLGSGTFASDTGALIDIHADWSAETISSSQAEITVTVSLDSYSIHLQAVPNSVNLNLGGQYVSLDAPAINYDGAERVSNVLASKTFTVDLAQGQSNTFMLNVEWHFGGTYGNVELPVIECGGNISLSR